MCYKLTTNSGRIDEMFPTRRCLFFYLVLVVIIFLICETTVRDVTSISKPVRKYGVQIMEKFNFGLFHSIAPEETTSESVSALFEYSTKHHDIPILNGTTLPSTDNYASGWMSTPSVSDSRDLSNFKGLNSTRKPSPTSIIIATSNESQRVKDLGSHVHTEKTYMETFLDVPEINFTDILRKCLTPYSRIFHSYDGGQCITGGGNRSTRGIPPTIGELYTGGTLPHMTYVTSIGGTHKISNELRPPVDFLPNFKNPCWVEKVNSSTPFTIRDGAFRGKLRCLPYFFVLGFPKCGTTDLHHRLSFHPDIKPPCTKEPHWWALLRFQGLQTLNSYLGCFDRAAADISGSLNYTTVTTRRSDKITMDCSSSTVWLQSNWDLIPQNDKTSSEPNITNIHAIHHLLPHSKFVIIMRNPVSRTFSGYMFFNKLTRVSAQDFHQCVNNSITELENCFKKRSVRSCVYDKKFIYNKLQKRPPCRLYVSLYSFYIEEWLAVFPREQFLFLKTEDYSANLTQSITQIYKFLGLAVPSEASLQEAANRPNANTRPREKNAVGQMLPETKRLLEKFYSPWNERLAKLLNDDRYLWR